MKTFWKVVLIIFLILLLIFLIIVGVAGYTFYQAIKLKDKLDSFTSEINALKDDCSNTENLESSAYDLRDEISSSCKNPILKFVIEENVQEDLCVQIQDDEFINSKLSKIELSCGAGDNR